MASIELDTSGEEPQLLFHSAYAPDAIGRIAPTKRPITVVGRSPGELLRGGADSRHGAQSELFLTPDGAIALDEVAGSLGWPPSFIKKLNKWVFDMHLFRPPGDTAGEVQKAGLEQFYATVSSSEYRNDLFREITKKFPKGVNVSPYEAVMLLCGDMIDHPWVGLEFGFVPKASDFLVMYAWHEYGCPTNLLIYASTFFHEAGEGLDIGEFYVRDYANLEDVNRIASEYCGADKKMLNQVFKVYESVSRTMWGEEVQPDLLTIEDAKVYFDTVCSYVKGLGEAEHLSEIIPVQIGAPVEFVDDLHGIDVACDFNGVPLSQVKGGARALTAVLEDFRTSNMLDNMLPQFKRKADRIGGILKEFAAGAADDGYVVELGIEVSSLATLLELKEREVGSAVVEEMAVFVTPAQAFLDQFAAWRTYEASLSSNRVVPLGAGAEVAHEVISDVLGADELLTGRARDRVKSYLADVDPESATTSEREGLARTNESLTSALARKALGAVGEEVEAAAKDGFHEARMVAQEAVKSAVIEQAPKLLNFANARKLYWLAKLVAFFTPGT